QTAYIMYLYTMKTGLFIAASLWCNTSNAAGIVDFCPRNAPSCTQSAEESKAIEIVELKMTYLEGVAFLFSSPNNCFLCPNNCFDRFNTCFGRLTKGEKIRWIVPHTPATRCITDFNRQEIILVGRTKKTALYQYGKERF
ncbi:MAG: hypothetical protein RI894_1229, partial [Bacteroidota bacterium]